MGGLEDSSNVSITLDRLANHLKLLVTSDSKGRVYYLNQYPSMRSCACLRCYGIGGLRQDLLVAFKENLSSWDKNQPLRISIIGAGHLLDALQFVAQARLSGFERIELDVFDLIFQDPGFTAPLFSDFCAVLKAVGVDSAIKSHSTGVSSEVTINIFNDFNDQNVLKVYKNNPVRRVIVSIDLLDGVCSPFRKLNAIIQSVAEGSLLLMTNIINAPDFGDFREFSSVMLYIANRTEMGWNQQQASFFNLFEYRQELIPSRVDRFAFFKKEFVELPNHTLDSANSSDIGETSNEAARVSFG